MLIQNWKCHPSESIQLMVWLHWFQVPHFKAQPLPDFNAVVLPEKKKPEPTKPEPFRLQIDERGAGRLRQWEQMVGQAAYG